MRLYGQLPAGAVPVSAPAPEARQDRQRYWDCMKWLGVTVLLSLVLFAMVGIISSALEIFFVLSTTLLARRLWYLERGGGKN